MVVFVADMAVAVFGAVAVVVAVAVVIAFTVGAPYGQRPSVPMCALIAYGVICSVYIPIHCLLAGSAVLRIFVAASLLQ